MRIDWSDPQVPCRDCGGHRESLHIKVCETCWNARVAQLCATAEGRKTWSFLYR